MTRPDKRAARFGDRYRQPINIAEAVRELERRIIAQVEAALGIR